MYKGMSDEQVQHLVGLNHQQGMAIPMRLYHSTQDLPVREEHRLSPDVITFNAAISTLKIWKTHGFSRIYLGKLSRYHCEGW